uniref:Alanyl-transfer RNA synthetases family profile domain-containing protein n=1 Tax=Clastoptera arizonana TaxID=38151 RepID=A0A1B6BYN1_9HEMI
MVFACQENSFLKEFKTTVSSCKKSQIKTLVNQKQTILSGYDVVFDDTILFPEGGGQPCDLGKLQFLTDGNECEIPVIRVSRRGSEAIHFIETEIKEGQSVKQVLNWERRFDHMQQHSGQHLITAVADKSFGCATLSWWLGEDISYIELDTPEFNNINELEKIVNDYILAATPVIVNVYEADNDELKKVRTRGLPDDHRGPVRVISIEGVDNNMCCGTHVSNLNQLQCIKVIKVEKGNKGHSLLYFLSGSRVLNQMGKMMQREQALTSILKNSPLVHAELVDKLQKSTKTTSKYLQALLKDLAVLEAAKIKQIVPKPTHYALHRKEGDSDFMNTLIREINDQDILLFLTVGEEKSCGNMVLYGKPEFVEALGPKICALLEGKGAGKGSKFQAKVRNLSTKEKASELIESYFKK